MRVLYLDFETTGVDALTCLVTEVGALYRDTDCEPAKLSALCYDLYYPKLSKEVVDVTGITDELLKKEGREPKKVFETLLFPLVKASDLIIAHNAQFDKTVYESFSKRLGLSAPQPPLGWLCSMADVPYPLKYSCKKLSHLAYDHGIMVDPSTLHRAINDVELLSLLMEKYSIPECVKYRDMPWVYIQAMIAAPWTDGGKERDLALKAGFSWERARGTQAPVISKAWVKRVKQDYLKEELSQLTFKTKLLTL